MPCACTCIWNSRGPMLLLPHPAHAAHASRTAHHKHNVNTCLQAKVTIQIANKQHRRQLACNPPCAAAAVSTPFTDLSEWLMRNGGSVGSITAGDCQMGDVTVRGLVALEDLPSGTAILSVPVSRCVELQEQPYISLAVPYAQLEAILSTVHRLVKKSSCFLGIWQLALCTLGCDC
jgi:hypothetical protein